MKPFPILASVLFLGVAAFALSMPSAANADISIGISINTAPPELPVYTQPPIPAPGYLWTPGYWAWSADVGDYYWVPGTWVSPPVVGYLWTPPYWGWNDGVYVFHDGYWGEHVGFYGGISYGYGYGGNGYEGGYWQGHDFYYNSSVNNVTNVHITNVYERNVTENRTTVSYNGGAGGIHAQPTREQLLASNEHHVAPTQTQLHHFAAAASNRELRASVNHGKPPIAATAHPGVLHGAGVTHAAAIRSAGSTHLYHGALAGAGVGGVAAAPHYRAVPAHTPSSGGFAAEHASPPHRAAYVAPPRPVAHPPEPAPHPHGPVAPHEPH